MRSKAHRDVDNPRGYYEWEAIKEIGKKPELLDDDALNGRAIKCVSMLLPRMPPQHDYKVIFMTRPIAEVVASQRQMVKRLGTKGAELDREQLQRGLAAHRAELLRWLTTAPQMKFIEIDYPALLKDPDATVTRLVEFLGPPCLTSPNKMAGVIDPVLHRQKERT